MPALYRSAKMLARKWDGEFESGFLQQPVCLSGEPRVYKSPALWRQSAGGSGREKDVQVANRELLGRFSLTGIDAVPPLESSDRCR